VAKLYANENFPNPVVQELRRIGHDVLTVLETGRSDQAWPDHEVLAFATREQRALMTLNRKHFLRLHESSPAHAGIILCTLDLDFPGQAQRIHEAITAAGDLNRKVLRVNRLPQ
jgi:hypothetical protein